MQQDNKTISMTAQELLDEGLHCYNQKNLKGALYFFELLYLIDRNNEELIFTIVNILQELKNYQKSISYIEALISLDPENENYIFSQAESYFHLQNYTKSLSLYLELQSLHPLNTHILQRLLDIYIKQNKRSEVSRVKLLLKDVEDKIYNSEFEIAKTVNLALSLVEQGSNDEAKALIESVLLFDKYNIDANGIYGALLSDEGSCEKALYYLDRVSNDLPDAYVSVYIKCLKELRGIGSAINYLKVKLTGNPDNHNLKKQLGYHYFNNQQYKDSFEILKFIKNEFQDKLEFSRTLALSRYLSINENKKWMNKDKLDAAAEELQAIYEKLPNDEHVLVELIKYYLNIGDIKKSYELACKGYFKSEEIREWNKAPYYNALRDRNRFFNSHIYGRVARPLLIDYYEVKNKVWNGEPLAGKKVVILREQGIGDEIKFASNYKWIVEQALHVDIFCSPRLIDEFSRIFPKANFHSVIEDESLIYMPQDKEHYLQSADFLILAGDLSALHYKKTNQPLFEENFYSISDEKKNEWKIKISKIVRTERPKVGIIWRSGLIDSSRSASYLSEKDAAEIINEIPEVEFINCMYVECNKDIEKINSITKGRLHKIPELDQKNDFENTAAMLSSLDLVIGASTATISLAHAVGTPSIIYGSDYLDEDGVLVKDALYYPNSTSISLPVIDLNKRKVAISKIISAIKDKLNI